MCVFFSNQTLLLCSFQCALIATSVAVACADKVDPYAAKPLPAAYAPAPYNPPEYKAAPAPYKPAPASYKPAPASYKPAPASYKPAPASYKPAPAPYRPVHTPSYKEEKPEPPQPFAYQYGVRDEYTGADFDKHEEQDAYGNLQGSYRVNLPDGRVQVVKYTADHENGYQADVSYEGVAQYPPEPKEGYGHAGPAKYAPKYAAAPKYAQEPKYSPAPKYENWRRQKEKAIVERLLPNQPPTPPVIPKSVIMFSPIIYSPITENDQ